MVFRLERPLCEEKDKPHCVAKKGICQITNPVDLAKIGGFPDIKQFSPEKSNRFYSKSNRFHLKCKGFHLKSLMDIIQNPMDFPQNATDFPEKQLISSAICTRK